MAAEVCIFFFVLLLTACQSIPPDASTATPAPVQSAWGNVNTLAYAEQADAPAVAVHTDQVTFAWITSDRTGDRQTMRRWRNGALTPPIDLTLPPTRPRDQRLYPALDGGVHLLWIDENGADRTPTLFSALVTSTTEIARGPLPVSDGRVIDFSASVLPDGTLWTAYTTEPISEPALILRAIDPEGRPALPVRVADRARFPASVALNEGSLLVFWLDVGEARLRTARFVEGVLLESAALTSSVRLGEADRLVDLRAGVDASHAYVFWNISRADGSLETWIASGAINDPTWNAPVSLTDISRLAPASGQGISWVAAAQIGDAIGFITLSGGQITSIEPIVSPLTLISAPAIVAVGDRVIAWSAPDPFAPAALQFTTDATSP